MPANHQPAPVRDHYPDAPRAGLPPAWRGHPDWLVAVVPALVALVVGGYHLGAPSLWRDEAYTISAAQRPAGQLLAMLQHVDAVHGPYYFVMHFVVQLAGISAVSLRLPSLIGMGIAAGVTGALGRRLALQAGWPAPAATGALAGLLLAGSPQATFYAQDARPYGPVIMFAVIATYLLVRAHDDGGRGWWVAYSAALVLTGLCNLFALMLIGTHAVSLLLAWWSGRRAAAAGETGAAEMAGPAKAAGGEGGAWRRLVREPWVLAVTAAVVLLIPMIVYGYRQSATLDWAERPGWQAIGHLIAGFAGSRPLIPIVGVLATGGAVTGWRSRRPGDLSFTGVTLPWLLLPATFLIVVSQVHPAYVERYVVLSIPALALLCAAGLTWLARLIAAAGTGRAWRGLAWLPTAAIVVAVAVLLVGPQQKIRRTHARADNLRGVARIIGLYRQPGDVIAYLPLRTQVAQFAYPAAFGGMRNVEQGQSPSASDTLAGADADPAVVTGRLKETHRVWVVRWNAENAKGQYIGAAGKMTLKVLAGMQLQHQWPTKSMIVSLYVPTS
jgi:mannosyltransferase